MKKTTLVTLGVLAMTIPLIVILVSSFSSTAIAESDGQAIFTAAKCDMCHAVPSLGIEAKVKSEKMKGPDIVAKEYDAEAMAKYLRKQGQIDGKDHKKDFKGTDEELNTLIAWMGQLK